MKFIASVVSIIALGFGLLGCSGGGNGGGGSSAPAFAVSTTAADFGVVGNAYTSTLVATGGTAPYTWTLFGGVLPAGLSLNPSTGTVTGIPVAPAGSFTATFTVRDSTGKTETGSVLFAIHPRTDRVSVDSSGTAGNGVSSAPSITSDGSLAAFASQSANFVTSVSGTQIYVHNRQTNQIELISRDSNQTVVNAGNGISSVSAISADGRFVAFVSQSTNLVTGVSGQQVYLRDRQTGQTTLVSKNSSGVTSNGGVNSSPALSSDGRYIAFISVATNLGAVGGNQQIYLHDRLTGVNGTTSLISQDSGATAGNGNSSTPSMSGDGRYVAFASLATNLLGNVSGQQIYLHDRNTGANGTNSLISHDNNGTPGQGNGASSLPSISSDGQVVAFVSVATNLLSPAPAVAGQQVYSHDRSTGTTSLVSKDNTVPPVAGDFASTQPSTNSDGGFVAFSSQATNLVAGSGSHIYVRALP